MGFRYDPNDTGLPAEGRYLVEIREPYVATPPGKLPHVVVPMFDVNDTTREWPLVTDRLMLRGAFTGLTHSILQKLGATVVKPDGYAELEPSLLAGKRVFVHIKHGTYVDQKTGKDKPKLEVNRDAVGHGYEVAEQPATPSAPSAPAADPTAGDIPF